MKNAKNYLQVIFTMLLALSLLFCNKKSDTLTPDIGIECEKKYQAYQKAVTEFGLDPLSKTKCEAFKQSLREILSNTCFGTYNNLNKAELEKELNSLNCQ